MEEYNIKDNYEKIMEFLCAYRKISKEELMNILKDRELKYLFFLLLKKYKCGNLERLSEDLLLKNKKSISYGMRKAEEKFFVNKEFRDRYFEIEELIQKII